MKGFVQRRELQTKNRRSLWPKTSQPLVASRLLPSTAKFRGVAWARSSTNLRLPPWRHLVWQRLLFQSPRISHGSGLRPQLSQETEHKRKANDHDSELIPKTI